MAISSRVAVEESAPSNDSALAALVSWLACDLEASLTRLRSLVDSANLVEAGDELAVVQQLVVDLVELHCGLGSPPRAGAFDLAFDDPAEQTAS
jgi:hypothetical protein